MRHDKIFWRKLVGSALLAMAFPLGAGAALVDLATVPLTTSTTSSVKPNIMFVLDNSGSMNWDYMPDWVVDARYCKNSSGYVYSGSSSDRGSFCCRNSDGDHITSYSKGSTCFPNQKNAWGNDSPANLRGMPPFYTASFNQAYYDPAIRYDPPKDYDGTTLTSYDGSSAAVPLDGYGIQTTATVRLTKIGTNEANYPDVEWCNGSSTTDCRRNDDYVLPSGSYTTMRATTAKGTAKFATSSTTTETRSVGPFYYVMVPGEYCKDEKLTTCATYDKPTGDYTRPARLRWCSDRTLTPCQAIQSGSFQYPRYPTVRPYGAASTDLVPGSFKRFDIVPGQTYGNYTHPTSGALIIDRKNRTDCGTDATDKTKRVCTYEQELKNFANWLAWYRSRMQMMKTSVSRAFQSLDSNYRVGFYTINKPDTNYLKIDAFTDVKDGQKDLWYKKLKDADPDGGTKLRSTFADVGRIYAGKYRDDPVQYSCQQNFAIVTTDGYWNSDTPSDVKTVPKTGSVLQIDGATPIGNLDAKADRPVYEGGEATYGTLADVAKYYYDTDLRTEALGNCYLASDTEKKNNLCTDNVFVTETDLNAKQHMTTFTLGLGIDGTLQYQKDYKTAEEGDYANITKGTGTPSNWPVPVQEKLTTIDDLWHAAVNGGGTYYSAKNASDLSDGLGDALSSIKVKRGAGAAAATSSLNPVANDNYAYVASYTTQKWIGNLEARTIDLSAGTVSEGASWCVENVYASSCVSPSESYESGGLTYCKTPDVTSANDCPSGTYDSTAKTCTVSMVNTCTGTLKSRVAADSDTRTIWMAKRETSAGAPLDNTAFSLQKFEYANMTTEQQKYFSTTTLEGLSQTLDATQRATLAGDVIVNYLRGQTGYEDRSANGAAKRLLRYREAVMGDALESQPVFMGKPKFAYTDPGYSAYIAAQKDRSGTVYIGTNDGMLHAFNANIDASSTDWANRGQERWAFVPSMVFKYMWKLADKGYKTKHVNFVNGSPVVSDVYDLTTEAAKAAATAAQAAKEAADVAKGEADAAKLLSDAAPADASLLAAYEAAKTTYEGKAEAAMVAATAAANAGTWRTILVAGLNGGGQGYYALDVTNPDAPILLWEIDSETDADLGYTFGTPVVTKKKDGTWVVLLSSGYNNTNTGQGYLYVRNALTGASIDKISTGEGSATTPSGFAKFSGWGDNPMLDNTATYVYGGDLLGNVWRFDINTTVATDKKKKIAILKDEGGNVQPITTAPELAKIYGSRVVFVGTGKYLETDDLKDPQTQSLYVIKDDGSAVLDSPRLSDKMVKQEIAASTTSTREGTFTTVNWSSMRGWYVDFPDSGERVHVNPVIDGDMLFVATTVPTSTACAEGGYAWLNYFNYLMSTGGTVTVAQKFASPIVGINVYYTGTTRRVAVTTSTNPTPQVVTLPGTPPKAFQGVRGIWREIP